LSDALWESRIIPKESSNQSPYLLVYGKELVLPINLGIKALMMACQANEGDHPTPL
jgi:hypothetical protein